MNADQKAYLLLFLGMLFWAGNTVLGRAIHEDIPPLALSFIRWSLASLIIFPIARKHLIRDWPVIKAHFPILLFLGTIGVGAYNSFQYSSLNYTSALNVLILQSSAPFIILIMAYLSFGDKITKQLLLGIAISSIGVLTILSKGSSDKLASLTFGAGDLLILAGIFCWSLYTVTLRKKPKMHYLSFAAVTFMIGASVNAPLFAIEHIYVRTLHADMTTALAIAYVSFFPSVLAYLFYNKGVEQLGSARAGAFIHLVPLLGTCLAIILLNEIPELFHLAGFALIMTGLWLTLKPRAQADQ